MSTPRFARGSKSRLFLYIGAITVAGVVVYFFHRAQVELYDYRKKSEKCLQQQESLSAQFQVIIEYKVRLEKSLQQEKLEHRRLRDELQGKLDEEKQLREKENLENINKYTSLQQQYKILQSNHEDLRVTQLQGLEAKAKLEAALDAAKQEVQDVQQAKDKEMENLKEQFLRLEVENDKLHKENKELTTHGKEHNSNINHLQKQVIQLHDEVESLQGELRRCEAHTSSPVQVVGAPVPAGMGVGSAPKASSAPRPSSSPVAVAPNLQVQVLQEPQHDHASAGKVSHASQKSTTPQINPDAVLSREKAANAAPMAVAAPDAAAKEPTPGAMLHSSRKEVSPRASW